MSGLRLWGASWTIRLKYLAMVALLVRFSPIGRLARFGRTRTLLRTLLLHALLLSSMLESLHGLCQYAEEIDIGFGGQISGLLQHCSFHAAAGINQSGRPGTNTLCCVPAQTSRAVLCALHACGPFLECLEYLSNITEVKSIVATNNEMRCMYYIS